MSLLIKPILLAALLCVGSGAHAQDPMSVMLPVITPELTPGKVLATKTPTYLCMPLFIVGDDELSHRWLKIRAPYLKSIHAVGMVVNVKTQAGLARMKSYGLTIYPVHGRDFARAFGLSHYPVLIKYKEIKQ